MSAVRVVGGSAACAGFSLAGMPVTEASGPAQAASLIASLTERPDIGVLLVEQGFLESLSDPVRRDLMRRPMPIVVPFPGPSWAQAAEGSESYVLELLRRAIGYRVRLR
jgi:vacuolar-type H+-ATPase subunit F/Vma7